MASPPAIVFERVSFAYGAGPSVLHEVSLAIPAGQAVAVIGVNGSGKTTLLRHLIGLLKPTAGRVTINGLDTATTATGVLARQVGFAFQQPEQQLFNPTVYDEVAFGPRNLGLRGAALRERVDETLAQFELTELGAHPPAVLSFSLRRLVALASIAALRAPILALDEPLVGLDGLWRRRVIAWLNTHHDFGGTTLLVTHHVRLAGKAERILVMHEGRLAADGPPPDVFEQPGLLRDAGLAEPFSVALGHALDLPGTMLLVRQVAEALAVRSGGRHDAAAEVVPDGIFSEEEC